MLWITHWFAHSPLFFPCVWTTHFAFYTQRCGKTVLMFCTIPKNGNFGLLLQIIFFSSAENPQLIKVIHRVINSLWITFRKEAWKLWNS